jgi:hypothetical protein
VPAVAERFETSRKIAEQADLSGSTPFIATGMTFADALSSAAAAGASNMGVVLVHGADPAANAATLATLDALGASAVNIAGSVASVSSGIQSSIAGRYPVTRFVGEDRFHTSALINTASFANSKTVYLALGTNFPDALAGGALAAATNAPLFIVRDNCIPERIHDVLTAWSPDAVVLFGSEASLNSNVANLSRCAPPPVDPGPANPHPNPNPNPNPNPQPANPGDTKNCSDFGTWRDAQNSFDHHYPLYGGHRQAGQRQRSDRLRVAAWRSALSAHCRRWLSRLRRATAGGLSEVSAASRGAVCAGTARVQRPARRTRPAGLRGRGATQASVHHQLSVATPLETVTARLKAVEYGTPHI